MPKLAGSGCAPAKVDINMTPMIDVVFQLLTFFLMTFQVATAEGDFNLKLPRESEEEPRYIAERLTIRIVAYPNGDLGYVQVGQGPPCTGPNAFVQLQKQIVRLAASARNAGGPEIEALLDVDERLRYEFLIQTVAALSARLNESGEPEPLLRKIKFAPSEAELPIQELR